MSASAVFGGIGLVMSALQYRSTVAAGKAEQEFYNAQARNRRLQGRVEAVEAKEKGNEILRRTKAPPPTFCLLYTSPSPRDGLLSRMPSSA